MKKIIALITLIVIISLSSTSQDCTNCSPSNLINSANFSSALGLDNKSWGSGSFAAGRYDTVTGNYSIGLGFKAIATGEVSFAAGGYVKATDVQSMAIGQYLHSSGFKSFTLGTGGSSTGFLTNNIPNSLMVGFGSSKPTFFVSTATSSTKTGKIGVGDITNPQAKLHIKLDIAEYAAIRIEPHSWMYENWAEIQFGNEQYAIRGTHNKGLGFYSPYYFVFNTGNVGIGTATPSQKLEVSGNLKTTGFIMEGGAGTGKVLTSDASGQAAWQEIPEDGHWMENGDDLYRLNGKVGIGTSTPSVKLEVTGNIRVNSLVFNNADLQENFITGKYEPLIYGSKSGGEIGGSSSLILQAGGTPTNNNRHIYFRTADQTRIFIHHNGNVGIGTTNTSSARLSVAGKIIAEEVKIILSVPQSDYVFEKEYELMPLTDLDHYIKTHKHLPGVPTAAEFAQEGYNVGEMDDLLLRKVEELTLYVIELQNEVTKLKHDYGVPKNNEQ